MSKTLVKHNGVWKDASYTPPASPVGVRIKIAESDPNKAVEYIDDAKGFKPMTRNDPGSWANHPLVTGIKPVVRKSDGTWKDLNKKDLSKCTDGTNSDITTIGNDAFTRFNTWWLSITTDAEYNYVRFASKKVDDTYYNLASFYKGADQGMFHYGCYHAYNSGSKIYSSASKTPSTNISTENFRVYSQARGNGFDQVGWYQLMYLQALFVLLFKGRQAQELIGRGLTSGSMSSENRTTYDNDYGMAGSSDSTDQMAFFWINNFWGNVFDYLGGAKTNGSCKLMTQTDGNPISPTNGNAGYKTHNTTISSGSDGYIQKTECTSTEVGFFPKQWGGDENQNWCDYGFVYASYFPYFGGYFNDYGVAGPFFVRFNDLATSTYYTYGSRLCYRLKVVE